MKYAHLYALFLMFAFCKPCAAQNKPSLTNDVDSLDKRLIIENSLPKGVEKYTDPNGKVWLCATFWTRITNETNHPVEFQIDFPLDSLKLPSSPGSHFKLFLPSDTMTREKEGFYSYGLPVLKSLEKGLQKGSSLKRTVRPKDSTAFYVVTLFNEGVEGILRTALSRKGQNLFYRVNDKEIPCGKIKFTLLQP